MLNEYLSLDKQVYWDYLSPHRDYFDLYWDNDVVRLTREDAKALIPILSEWLKN